jgi:hypothetical protein
MKKIIIRFLAIIGLIFLYMFGIFILIFMGGNKTVEAFDYLSNKID